MRARWEGLHAALVGSVATLEMNRQFEQARQDLSELQPFMTVASLLEFLGREGANLEDKNTIYSALVHAVQGRASWAPLATRALWCGMWPGLDAIYQRQRRYFAQDPEELISLISVTFTTLIGDLDLQCVRRVPATLIRSTERDVVRTRQRQRATELASEPLLNQPLASPTEVVGISGDVSELSGLGHSTLGIPVGLSWEHRRRLSTGGSSRSEARTPRCSLRSWCSARTRARSQCRPASPMSPYESAFSEFAHGSQIDVTTSDPKRHVPGRGLATTYLGPSEKIHGHVAHATAPTRSACSQT